MLMHEFIVYGYIKDDDEEKRIPLSLCMMQPSSDPDWMQAAVDLMVKSKVIRILNVRYIGIINYY